MYGMFYIQEILNQAGFNNFLHGSYQRERNNPKHFPIVKTDLTLNQ